MKTDFPTASAGSSQAPSAAVEKSQSALNTKILTLPQTIIQSEPSFKILTKIFLFSFHFLSSFYVHNEFTLQHVTTYHHEPKPNSTSYYYNRTLVPRFEAPRFQASFTHSLNEDKEGTDMSRMVHCLKLNKQAEGLDFPPYPGELGKKLFDNVSKEAWQQWIKHQTMLVNENRLNLADARARKYLAQQMEKYFFGEGADTASGYVPPVQ